jgi:beta-phosphoglucomutase-like phosphatase (HAD superfamily)
MIVNKLALAAALALAFSGAVHAAAIALEPGAQPAPALLHAGRAGLALAPRAAIVIESRISELPEPEVFAMMLVGLVLIGYRASRDSDEKFK